jgi:sarcosine oxidase subunit beta
VETADIVIIGAGIVGLSVAYHLAKRNAGKIVIMEKKAGAGWGETARCTGGLRHQFSSSINVIMSSMSIPFFRTLEEETGVAVEFHSNGYMFITSKETNLEKLKMNVQMQRSLGVPTKLISPKQANELVPALKIDNIIGGTFCPTDGHASPDGVIQGLLRLIRKQNVSMLLNEAVYSITRRKDKSFNILSSHHKLSTPIIVNATGAWAKQTGKLIGISMPVTAHHRQVVLLEKMPILNKSIPLITDADTGWYLLRSEGGRLTTGGIDTRCPHGWDTKVQWSKLEDLVKVATKHFPVFNNACIQSVFVGLRSMSPDDNAILGEIPEIPGFYWACGFSGHGFMHAPAAGEILAQLIIDKKSDLDISSLKPDRFISSCSNNTIG